MSKKTTAETIGDLSNADPQVVLKALDGLCDGGIPADLSFAQVLPLLSDSNWKIRSKAAACLGLFEPAADAVVAGLTGVLNDPTAPVRASAAVALGMLGACPSLVIQAAAVLALTNALVDPAPSVRVAVGIALQSLGHPQDADMAVNEWLTRKIEKKLPKPATVEKYVAALKENDPKKQISAMHKLSDVVRERQADLSALIIPCVPDLIALLSDPSWKVRAWAVRLLGRIGPPADAALPHLMLALQDRTIPVRECAAYAIGLMGEKANEAIPLLEKTLNDPVSSVRKHAHMALRHLRHKDDALGMKICEDDELVGYPIDDEQLDIHYWELGHVRHRPWPYQTNLILWSQQFTLEQLRDRVRKNPRDYQAKVMLAERMDNWVEKIEYIRQNYSYPGTTRTDEEHEWQKAWYRVCPSFSFSGIGSIYEYIIPEKYQESLDPGNSEGVWERICTIRDFIDPSGFAKQGFLGERSEEYAIGAFDRIIKLSFQDFLCRQGDAYTLYHAHDRLFLMPVLRMTLEGEPTLEKILAEIAERNPKVFEDLSASLRKDPDQRGYISLYRLYVIAFDEHNYQHIYGRAIIANDFQTTLLDLV